MNFDLKIGHCGQLISFGKLFKIIIQKISVSIESSIPNIFCVLNNPTTHHRSSKLLFWNLSFLSLTTKRFHSINTEAQLERNVAVIDLWTQIKFLHKFTVIFMGTVVSGTIRIRRISICFVGIISVRLWCNF